MGRTSNIEKMRDESTLRSHQLAYVSVALNRGISRSVIRWQAEYVFQLEITEAEIEAWDRAGRPLKPASYGRIIKSV
jgi:hypothetical protein